MRAASGSEEDALLDNYVQIHKPSPNHLGPNTIRLYAGTTTRTNFTTGDETHYVLVATYEALADTNIPTDAGIAGSEPTPPDAWVLIYTRRFTPNEIQALVQPLNEADAIQDRLQTHANNNPLRHAEASQTIATINGIETRLDITPTTITLPFVTDPTFDNWIPTNQQPQYAHALANLLQTALDQTPNP